LRCGRKVGCIGVSKKKQICDPSIGKTDPLEELIEARITMREKPCGDT